MNSIIEFTAYPGGGGGGGNFLTCSPDNNIAFIFTSFLSRQVVRRSKVGFFYGFKKKIKPSWLNPIM